MATVLLVEDYRDDRQMYAEYLRGLSFRVIEADNAADAFALAPTADIIVTDLWLETRSEGMELIRRLRADHRTSELPILVVTACALDEERQRAGAAGCNAFLIKPCLPSMLAAELRRLLQESNQRLAT